MDPATIAAVAGVGSKLLGGLFGKKSKDKAGKEQMRAQTEALNLKQRMGEDKRLGQLGAGQSIMQQLAGRGFTNISPEAAASLGQRREYDFSKAVADPTAGSGSGFLSGLLGDVSDTAFQYAANEMDQPMEAAGPLASQIQTTAPVATRLGGGYEDPENYKGF